MVREMAKELSDCARMTERDMARATAHVTLSSVMASYRASEMLAVSQGEI